jgi:DNA mismatch endonuclease (patch repair protein)
MESSETRRRTMQAVKSKNTVPEISVRRAAHRMGYRFRLHRKDLPGKPDLVFPRLRKVIFVNGCFWHGHDCARGARVPVQNREYWVAKVARNQQRDKSVQTSLQALGWNTLIIWECETRDGQALRKRLVKFLD